MSSIARLVVSLGANVAGFETDMKRASRNQQRRMQEMKRDAEAMAKGLALAFTAAAGAMTAIVRSTTNTADSMAKLGQRLGASTEALSELGFVAEKSGVDFRTLEMGLQRMTRRIGEVAFLGKGEAKQALQILGLEAKKLSELPLDKQFEAIAEQLSKVENTSQRTSLAMKIFDAEGVKLVQLMEQGADGIAQMREEMRKTGAVISTDLARNAERFNNNLAMMNQYTKGVGVQLTTGLLPGLIEIQEYFLKNATATDRFASAGEWLADVIKRLIAAFIVMKGIATALGKVLVGVAMAIYNTFKGLFLAVKRPIDQLAQALDQLRNGELKKAAAALGDIPKAMADGFKEGAKEAVKAIEFIGTGLEDVQGSINDAFDLLNFRAEESEEYISEVIVTARRLPGVFDEAAWALEEVTVTGKRMKDVIVPAVEKSAKAFDSMTTAMDEGVRILERSFSSMWDNLLSGSESTFDNILDGFRSLISSMINEATTRKIFLNVQQGIAGTGTGPNGGINWGALGTDLLKAFAVIGGGLLGGGGQYANIGSAIGAIAGQSLVNALSGTWLALGSIGGPIGIAISAVLGGLIGGLFDKKRPPVLEVSGFDTSRQSGSDRDNLIKTLLGDVFIRSRRINAEGLAEISSAIEEFDNSIGKLLDGDQLNAVVDALDGWGEKMTGSAIDIETLLSSRMSVILDALGDDIEAFVNRGADLTEKMNRLQVALAAQDILAAAPEVFGDKTLSDFLRVIEAFKKGGETITDTFNRVLPLLETIVNVQKTLRQYADTSAADQFAMMISEAGMSLAEAVATTQSALGDAIINYDGSIEQLQTIGQLAMAAREGEIRLLQQIDGIQKGINANLTSLYDDILNAGVDKSAEEIIRDAERIYGQLGSATSAEDIAALEREFTQILRGLSTDDQAAFRGRLLRLVDDFRAVSNEMLFGMREDAAANADSSRELVDIFLNDIGDPLDILASSNRQVAEELGNIDDSIQSLGPVIEDSIRSGFRGASVNVTVVMDRGGMVNE